MIRTLCLFMLLAVTATAAPHPKLTAVPRAVGRTARNMVTFRDKTAALEEWATLAAAVGDGIVSEHVLHVLPSAYEANPIFGKHPTLVDYLALTIPTGMYSATLTQWGHERMDGTRQSWQTALPLLVNGGIHGFAIGWNEHEIRVTCSKAGLQCR